MKHLVLAVSGYITSSITASNLVKKKYYNTKISEIEKKITYHSYDIYFTTEEFNMFAVEIFAA